MAIFFHTFTFIFFVISTILFFQLNITDGGVNNQSAKQSGSNGRRYCFVCNSVEHGKNCISISMEKGSQTTTNDRGYPEILPRFTIKCKGPCSTIISLSGDVIVRGCGQPTGSGFIGCIGSDSAVTCTCDEDYCNTGQNIRSCTTSTLKLLVFVFVVHYYIGLF